MPPAGFEPTIPARERPLTNALDRSGTVIGSCWYLHSQIPPLGTERSTEKKELMEIRIQVTESIDTYNNTADGGLRYVGKSYNQGGIYFLHVRLTVQAGT